MKVFLLVLSIVIAGGVRNLEFGDCNKLSMFSSEAHGWSSTLQKDTGAACGCKRTFSQFESEELSFQHETKTKSLNENVLNEILNMDSIIENCFNGNEQYEEILVNYNEYECNKREYKYDEFKYDDIIKEIKATPITADNPIYIIKEYHDHNIKFTMFPPPTNNIHFELNEISANDNIIEKLNEFIINGKANQHQKNDILNKKNISIKNDMKIGIFRNNVMVCSHQINPSNKENNDIKIDIANIRAYEYNNYIYLKHSHPTRNCISFEYVLSSCKVKLVNKIKCTELPSMIKIKTIYYCDKLKGTKVALSHPFKLISSHC